MSTDARTARSRGSVLAGTRPLLAVSLRQDAHRLAPWVAIVTALSASSLLAYAWIFPDQADRARLAATLGANPAMALVFGPAQDLTTADGFNAWRAGQLGAFFAALMAVLAVVRNSRANEDSGQAELIASGVVARGTRLAVAVTIATVGAVAIGVVSCLVTVLCGGDPVATVVLSASYTAAALVFAGVAAVAAQVGSDARTATGTAVGVLGTLYVLRGWIDASSVPDWVTWLTPFGWLAKAAPASANDPWPLVLTVVVAAALVGLAFLLQARRDFGQGLVAIRPGPARARLAGTVWGLAVRLHLGAASAWLVGFAALGFLFGTIVSAIQDVVADNPAVARVLARESAGVDPAFAFVVTMTSLLAIIAAVSGVQVALRLHAEELDHRLEPLLAGSLRRAALFASHALIALLVPGLAMLAGGTTLGLVAHAERPSVAVADVVAQAAVMTTGVWVLVGIALAAVGARPQARLLGWVGVVATFGLTIVGPTFDLPAWVLDVSPLRHVPTVTASEPEWLGLLSLCGIAALLVAAGFAGFRRRDVG